MWLYIIVSFQFLLMIAGLIFIFKKISSPTIIIKNDSNSVREGVKSAFKELEQEKEEEELLMSKLDRDKEGIGIFTSNSEEEPINSKGDLIPFNCSESEKEILRMFYNNQ